MRAAETRLLLGLAGRWEREAKGVYRRMRKLSPRAGHSGPNGLGDEGWADLHNLGGVAATLEANAQELRRRVMKARGR